MYKIVQHKTIPVRLDKGWSVEPYEATLTAEGLFRATNNGLKFATLDHAVAHWHSTHTRYYEAGSTYYQVHGPRGGRYCPLTGKRQPSPKQ